jgi:hypothetical protein
MRMQDLEYWRDPLYSYGPWLSQGEESGCQSFHDNPGNTGNWNNTYEQWTAQQAWRSYLVHGGPKEIVNNLAKYAECDVKGTLAKFDTNGNDLIQYSSGTLPGNDADSVAFKYYGNRPQDRTESSFWYSGAKAAAAEYSLLGNKAKAAEMNAIAARIKDAILGTLWADGPIDTPGGGGEAIGPRVAGQLGNAVRLSGSGDYVNLPSGIVSGLGDFTVSTWVNPAANSTWSRVFDFGTGTNLYMFLTVSAGATPRFAITSSGPGGEQQLNGTAPLPLNQWSHLAVTLAGSTGTLYVNGTPVATNPSMTLHPSSLGQHQPELDRALAVQRPVPERHGRRFPDLRAGAGRRRRAGARRRAAGRGRRRLLPLRRGQRRGRGRLVRGRARRHHRVADQAEQRLPPNRVKTPGTAAPNYNQVDFPTVQARLVRVMMTRATGFAVGLKEVQVFRLTH